ncbi:glycosyltransferase family 2 protein [Ligilactobacillus salivarius]|uniref:glycosyltransferase family 2 protein n=1 Tax=Ligilactobacillus salivarius TaxID=1624 RepID=UPI0013DE5DEB|nr:glycosyltransferase family 2 protein [Ligilactobacillus salivarius]MBE5067629.1 glycosyltransferase family 2 protein [Ligilactobacillus salivarius]MDM8284634.1 glycosyltransferase family 2 protein [Ligilactobacillus salivarius]QIG35624.1 glycosyltransferase family 2 protein [Ligilactobacillus salivarius]
MVALSICMPVYNVGRYLNQCLESISQQTFRDFEVIMVDNGSTDNSFEICQEYVFRDSRFKLYHQSNFGVATARNTCLKHMYGEFVAWIDGDDWVEKDYLETLVNLQTNTNADIIHMGFKSYRNDNMYVADFKTLYGKFNYNLPKKVAISDVFVRKYGIITVWGDLVNAQLYKGFVFSEDNTFEDTGNKFKLYLQANDIVLSDQAKYIYRVHGESLTQNIMRDTSELKRIKMTISNYEKLLYYLRLANFEFDYFESLYRDWLNNEIDRNSNEKIRKYLVKHRRLS